VTSAVQTQREHQQALLSLKNQLLCLWGGPAGAAGWFIGFFVIAGLFPPISPNMPVDALKAYYLKDANALFAGCCIMMFTTPLFACMYAAISEQLKRIEGSGAVLANAQMVLGSLMVLFFILPAFNLGIAAFRPERSAEAIQTLSDGAWLPFVSAFQTTFWTWIVIGVAILRDKDQKVFPRWLGHFNIWVALSLILAGFTFFTKTGPFAWDGAAALWIVVVTFEAWFLVMFWVVRKNLREQMRALGAG